jgi:hypothetical protein
MTWCGSVTNKWRNLQRLPARERWLLLQACCLLPLTAAVLRAFSFKRVYAALAALSLPSSSTWRSAAGRNDTTHSQTHDEALDRVLTRASNTSRLVQIAARHSFIAANCLPRSLVLWWLLRRQGIESDLRIGVSRQDGQFAAHAWVEYQGLPLSDEDNAQRGFTPFSTAILPPQREAMMTDQTK